MALIAMAVYDTDENERTQYTLRTLASLMYTVNLERHRIIVVDNASCEATKKALEHYHAEQGISVITSPTNLGTAEAINLAWRLRRPGEHAVKMDNDVEFHRDDWADELEDAIARDPGIGICGLKRKDCIERPDRDDWYKSELYLLPHEPGQRWIIGERVNHVMGTCQMYNSALLDKIGFLFQPRLYGYDDALAAVRCKVAGFTSVFLPHIEIDHIDPGDKPYQKWKESEANKDFAAYERIVRQYKTGERSIYYNPFQHDTIWPSQS
jgi:GT2 family glycosyltransferase